MVGIGRAQWSKARIRDNIERCLQNSIFIFGDQNNRLLAAR